MSFTTLPFLVLVALSVAAYDLLPQRVWIVCANCPRFPDCDEVAVMRHLDAGGA